MEGDRFEYEKFTFCIFDRSSGVQIHKLWRGQKWQIQIVEHLYAHTFTFNYPMMSFRLLLSMSNIYLMRIFILEKKSGSLDN